MPATAAPHVYMRESHILWGRLSVGPGLAHLTREWIRRAADADGTRLIHRW